MEVSKKLKDVMTIVQFGFAAFKMSVDILGYMYHLVYPKENIEKPHAKKSGEVLNSAVSSTQILEEISVFRDENGETKTTISRKIIKKVFNPEVFEAANDNVSPPDVRALTASGIGNAYGNHDAVKIPVRIADNDNKEIDVSGEIVPNVEDVG